MKTSETNSKSSTSQQRRRVARGPSTAKIHPIIVFPFRPPEDPSHLAALYAGAEEWVSQPEIYTRPITVIDRKTHYRAAADPGYQAFRAKTMASHSDILDAWTVDTCQMWYTALGAAYERGSSKDVYWVIPGDFDYGSPVGTEVLGRLPDLPAICLELEQDICVGEVATDPCHSKQLIDTHGTFALLYNWFPSEAREIRQYTERPRSEFFAIRHDFLGEMLNRRWYAYEQTMVMLLHAVFRKKRITRFSVGDVSDLPEGRDTLASAMQQVERTERVVKSLWRERHGARTGWTEQYRRLEAQSEQIRRSALIILEKLLV
ncbi:MAG: hypothetical protein IT581_04345 [Verrucomicrobiales bacterium]|nr:hypothetical protein [Verrucomicrobiales bacterium]